VYSSSLRGNEDKFYLFLDSKDYALAGGLI
jgi:hypothetical protein